MVFFYLCYFLFSFLSPLLSYSPCLFIFDLYFLLSFVSLSLALVDLLVSVSLFLSSFFALFFIYFLFFQPPHPSFSDCCSSFIFSRFRYFFLYILLPLVSLDLLHSFILSSAKFVSPPFHLSLSYLTFIIVLSSVSFSLLSPRHPFRQWLPCVSVSFSLPLRLISVIYIFLSCVYCSLSFLITTLSFPLTLVNAVFA